MPEENKNLEAQKKKPSKSWRFRIGLGLIVLAIGLFWWLSQLLSGPEGAEVPMFGAVMYLPISLLLIGIFFIWGHYFLKYQKKEKFSLFDWVIFICVIFITLFLINLSLGNFIYLTFLK